MTNEEIEQRTTRNLWVGDERVRVDSSHVLLKIRTRLGLEN
jgi:hypothetical protein